jgi:hypothetical protein
MGHFCCRAGKSQIPLARAEAEAHFFVLFQVSREEDGMIGIPMRAFPAMVAGAMALAGTSPSRAAVVLFDDFDAENGGASLLNYAGFANFTVSGGTVDIIGQGGFGLSCVGGAGSCVDLDGSTGNGGTLTTNVFYSFNAGDVVTLSILLSGNQRGGAADEFSFGFNTSVSTAFNNVIITGPFGPAPLAVGNLGPGFFLGSGRPNAALGLVASGEPYTPYSISFVAGNAGTLNAFVGTASADNVGPVLDNFSLSIGPPSSAVPEPAAWAMMILGFGFAGAAMRRRKERLAI